MGSSSNNCSAALFEALVGDGSSALNASVWSPSLSCSAWYWFQVNVAKSTALSFVSSLALLISLVVNLAAVATVVLANHVPLITKILLCHLSLCFCGVSLIAMPSTASVDIFDDHWLFGQDLCRIYEMFNVVFAPLLFYHFAVVAIDQRIALNRLISHGKVRHAWDALKKCIALWIICVLFGVSSFLGWRTWLFKPKTDRCKFIDDSSFVIFRLFVTFIAPCLGIVAFFHSFKAKVAEEAEIIKKKYRDAKHCHDENVSGLHMKLADTDIISVQIAPGTERYFEHVDDDLLGSEEIIKKQKILWRKMKDEQQISAAFQLVSGVSVICWAPHYLSLIGNAACSCIPHFVTRICLWSGYCTAIVVPVIYMAMVPRFRRAFRRLIFLCCGNSASSSSSTETDSTAKLRRTSRGRRLTGFYKLIRAQLSSLSSNRSPQTTITTSVGKSESPPSKNGDADDNSSAKIAEAAPLANLNNQTVAYNPTAANNSDIQVFLNNNKIHRPSMELSLSSLSVASSVTLN